MSINKKSYKFKAYFFDPKTREVHSVCIYKTKPMTHSEFKDLLLKEKSQPVHKNAIFELI